MTLRHCFISMTLLLTLLCLLLSVPVYAADAAAGLSNFSRDLTYEDGMFSDVPDGEWFSQNVAEAYEYGLMKGNGSGAFLPGGNIQTPSACADHRDNKS
jgi:hypothetical protein